MSLVTFPRQFLVDLNGTPRVGAKASFFQSGTSTLITVYTTPAYSAAHQNPVESVAGGLFPAVYVNSAVNATYKMVITDSAAVPLYTEDNIPALGFTASDIGATLYPRTDAEIAAGVTPVSLAYPSDQSPRFGTVGDDATNNSTALNNQLLATRYLKIPTGVYRVTSAVTVGLDNTIIEGDGEVEIVTNNTTAFDVTADNVTIRNIRHRSLHTGAGADAFVRAFDVSGLTVDSCTIQRGVINHRSTASTPESGSRVVGCKFTGDYSGANGADFPNILEFRGITDVKVESNQFECTTDFYRVIKASTAIGDTAPFDTGRCRRVLIVNNTFNISGDNVQQVIDLFASAEQVVIHDNIFEINGTSVPLVISTKPGDAGTSTQSSYQNVSVCGNTFVLGSGVDQCIELAGAWGLAWFTVPCKATVCNNHISTSTSEVDAQITVKGMTDAVIAGNTIERNTVQFGRAIAAGNNQRLSIHGNHATSGAIELVGNASTPAAEAYGNQPQSISILGNTIDDLNSQGAVAFFNITSCEEITVADNHLRNQTDTATVQGAVYFNTVSGVAYLNIHDNRANFANTAKNIVSGTPTVSQRTEHDNSWNVHVATGVNFSDLADGAGESSSDITVTGLALGDWVRVAAPEDLAGMLMTAYCKAANTAVIRAQNESGSNVNLASGSFRLTWGKG